MAKKHKLKKSKKVSTRGGSALGRKKNKPVKHKKIAKSGKKSSRPKKEAAPKKTPITEESMSTSTAL